MDPTRECSMGSTTSVRLTPSAPGGHCSASAAPISKTRMAHAATVLRMSRFVWAGWLDCTELDGMHANQDLPCASERKYSTPSTSGDCCAARFQFGLRSRLNAVGTATRRRRPYSGGSVRPRVIRDGTLRAWFRAYSGRAGFHAHLNGYS